MSYMKFRSMPSTSVSEVTGLTLRKSKTERGTVTGDELERQKVPHNDKSQLSESAMHFLCIHATSVPSDRLFSKQESWFPIGGAASSPSVVFERKY